MELLPEGSPELRAPQAGAAVVLAVSPAAASTSPRALAFQTISARASAESFETVGLWIRRETRNGLLPPCDARPRRMLYDIAAEARRVADDQWLLAELVKAQGGNPGKYVARA